MDGKFEERARAFARHNGGLISRKELLALGVTRGRISKWRRMKLLREIFPALYCFGPEEPSWELRATSALRWAGPSGVLVGPTAAAIHGIAGYERKGAIHVCTQGHKKRPRGLANEIVTHERRDPESEHHTIVKGFRVTTAERTLIDLGQVLDLEDLEPLIDGALRSRITNPGRLRKVREDEGPKHRRGLGTFGRIVDTRGPTLVPVDSELEVDFLKFCQDQRIELPREGYWLRNALDVSMRRGDFVYLDERIVVQVESKKHHEGWHRQVPDMERDNDWVGEGWVVLRFAKEHMHRPGYVARIIRYTLRIRRQQLRIPRVA